MSNEPLSDPAEWGPVISFWIDTEGYSQRDRVMFTAGVEFQMLYAAIKSGRGWQQAIHTENESRVKMLCNKLGVSVQITPYDDTYSNCEIPATDENEN